ncbi:RNA-directed DNA polymerase, eukaryota [Tanacetum coccineum]
MDNVLGGDSIGSKNLIAAVYRVREQEWNFHRGLRQGDPLSPFLFILVMESLHVAFQRVIERGMFNPIIIGKDARVSNMHLFYADDAMFNGKWSTSNVNVLVMMLHCFFLASGWKISVNKSGHYGVGVHSSDVQMMADSFGCLANSLPFTYLGVKVGANMDRINAWQDVIQKVTSKLSKWKAKTLLVGGRLTLTKSVLGSLPTYYMSLFKVPYGVLNQIEGLRNSFFMGADSEERKKTWLASSHKGCSVWLTVHKAITQLKTKGVDLMEYCKKVIENGNTSSFWHDKWIGGECFKGPRGVVKRMSMDQEQGSDRQSIAKRSLPPLGLVQIAPFKINNLFLA